MTLKFSHFHHPGLTGSGSFSFLERDDFSLNRRAKAPRLRSGQSVIYIFTDYPERSRGATSVMRQSKVITL